MNVYIIERSTSDVVARYEVHLTGSGDPPPDQDYFDDAWRQAVADSLVDADRRDDYRFQLQRPKTLYESSR